MNSPDVQVKRLFVGFTCSIVFLAVFAVLVAYNTEAESAGYTTSVVDGFPLTITIPTAKPEETIRFYKKLGFRTVDSLTGDLDVVCLEKFGTPYKLEICHNRFSEAGPISGGVSGMSFPVPDLKGSVGKLKTDGLTFMETRGTRNGVSYASLQDPNGIHISLFQMP